MRLTRRQFRSHSFLTLRKQLDESQAELADSKKQAHELQTIISDSGRELMGVKAELAAAEKGGVEAINELKSTDKLISESLKAELDRLREDYNFAVNERDAQKSQLIDALLAKDKFRKEAEDIKELQENLGIASAGVDGSDAAKKAGEKIEKLRARLIERKQVSYPKHPAAIHSQYNACLTIAMHTLQYGTNYDCSNLSDRNKKEESFKCN